jgi:hypothetical protein
MPPVPVRDLEIQKRESDLAVASFGRGFFILDDYSALRQMTPAVFQSEGTLFAPGRKARLFTELGYYHSQGENIGSSNPTFGATLSYFLSADEPTATGADAPRVVLQISDASGKTIRELDAPSRAGLHRVAWDLRETGAAGGGGGRGFGGGAPADAGAVNIADAGAAGDAAPAGRGGAAGRGAAAAGRGAGGGGGGRGGRGGGGALVKPGTYTVTLGKMAGGTLTPIGQPQKVEVIPLEGSNR